jgi:hypothetical protein
MQNKQTDLVDSIRQSQNIRKTKLYDLNKRIPLNIIANFISIAINKSINSKVRNDSKKI